MEQGVIEAAYPITFREEDAILLGEELSRRQNVELIGMRRVGISNFLRFFLYHRQVIPTYVGKERHLFIPVDLNDLVERELFPFWTLCLKRIADTVSRSALPDVVKKETESLFVSGIQSQDLFLLIDAVRQAVLLIVEKGYRPTLFFLRFDRIKDAATTTFLDNLQGLQDASNLQLSYVFTSYRRLHVLSPHAFSKSATVGFTKTQHMLPAKKIDTEQIYDSLCRKYSLTLDKASKQALLTAVSGNIQYLHLGIIILKERQEEKITSSVLVPLLEQDERIMLQSEELWESLTGKEKDIVQHALRTGSLMIEEKKNASYLLSTGFLREEGRKYVLFSPLFAAYVKNQEEKNEGNEIHFTKKEHHLFSLLQERIGIVRTREEIIEAVWPESVEFGVSDWAIDRLVARVRGKLKKQKSQFEIVTIRTRGYTVQKR